MRRIRWFYLGVTAMCEISSYYLKSCDVSSSYGRVLNMSYTCCSIALGMNGVISGVNIVSCMMGSR